MQNVGGCINERVAVKLSVQPPSAYRVQTYLERIADEHKVSWKPMKALTAESMAEPTAAPDGFSVQVGAGSGLVQAAEYSVTGNSNNNSSVGGGSHGRVSAPLLSPPPVDPSITTASRPHQQQQQLPQQHDLSRPHVPNVNPNDEVDIYIPGIASVRLEDNTTMEQGSNNCSNMTMQNQDNYNAQDTNNGSNGREELNKVMLYTIPIHNLHPQKEDDSRPHFRSHTVSPEANTGLPRANQSRDSLDTVLLTDDDDKIAFQITFDSLISGQDIVEKFLRSFELCKTGEGK